LIQATTTRTLGMAKKAGTKKAVAVLQTVERIKKLATKYKIQFTDAMQAEIDSKAKAAWKK
jgi:hypothetical protein